MPARSSEEVRTALVHALEADLIGPFYPDGHEGPTDEVLPLPPSRWYLTGFLAPQSDPDTYDPTSEEELGAGPDEDEEESAGDEPEPKQKHRFQSSMGMSVLLPPPSSAGSGAPETIRVSLEFAEYVKEAREVEGKRRPKTVWRRVPQPRKTVELPVTAVAVARGTMVPDSPGIWVMGKLETAEAPGLDEGTRALSLFVVNRRAVDGKPPFDEQYIFQVAMEVECERGLVARPNRQGEHARDWDDRVADLQFRDRFEYAVGHGVSVDVPDGQDPVTLVRTAWMPRHEVRRVVTHSEPGVETRMEVLGDLADGNAARAALTPLVAAYGTWLDGQGKTPLDSKERREARDELVRQARQAKDRIARGIECLAADPQVLEAFRLANRAMAQSSLQRSPSRYDEDKRPAWRLFQLAFVLMNLVGVADEHDEDRENVELIFFPTGGGKTEAYLGVIGFTLVLRRLRGQSRDDKGLGVAVLLRYTLRLLTLDQLGRAATLMCALEMLRREAPDKLGEQRFAVGLWVGRTATANTLDQVKKLVIEYKNSASKTAPSPFPLTDCPWCFQEPPDGDDGDSDEDPGVEPDYEAAQRAQVHETARQFAESKFGGLWPGAVDERGQLREDVLYAPPEYTESDKFTWQYVRSNVGPLERYTLTLPGALRHRLAPDESGFENLYLAGEWTRNGVEIGSIEAAIMSGFEAARAIHGAARPLFGEHAISMGLFTER